MTKQELIDLIYKHEGQLMHIAADAGLNIQETFKRIADEKIMNHYTIANRRRPESHRPPLMSPGFWQSEGALE